MKDSREEWYDPVRRVSVTVVDVTTAAATLASGHLSGPTASRFLAEGLAAVALIGAETSEKDEVVSIQMKCDGPLGGLNVECSEGGFLRGYTEKKVLDEFDGLGKIDPAKVLGRCRYQVTRSVPGRIISQGVSASLDGYLAGSLQRRAALSVYAEVEEDGRVVAAKGVMVEDMPDAEGDLVSVRLAEIKSIAVSSRRILDGLGLKNAELKKTSPLSFGCRCSRERIEAVLAALPEEERRSLPPDATIVCHMCGRTFVVGPQAVRE